MLRDYPDSAKSSFPSPLCSLKRVDKAFRSLKLGRLVQERALVIAQSRGQLDQIMVGLCDISPRDVFQVLTSVSRCTFFLLDDLASR